MKGTLQDIRQVEREIQAWHRDAARHSDHLRRLAPFQDAKRRRWSISRLTTRWAHWLGYRAPAVEAATRPYQESIPYS